MPKKPKVPNLLEPLLDSVKRGHWNAVDHLNLPMVFLEDKHLQRCYCYIIAMGRRVPGVRVIVQLNWYFQIEMSEGSERN